ncbi:ArnT family glycosyltransferase [Pseudarthrobacter niigatensis]|uniref:4-amino-4-deoxy-L-arabinose transferase-like glycosyltransferase n=1 Tax=Pseudarthrobacter niigatensis TaxID=369935 RepID=A0AAJ1WHD7_9MICC|nr:glycosyltransferase family 39 protein [Pseudarthrobacter niigatensis]MDQ0147987.1 4-amino-4-deoxy-L-arabinose transferase-like glycosyltransferase [Pseudarthrobacter niigatensis]MDQ0264177.1 4-amino-4-deoxy-L-arabinose transferase-like glycosyltransferase [Pseudarthrobacter niigatensis]
MTSPIIRSSAGQLTATTASLARYWPELVLFCLAGSVYFWNLPINGWGNPYYAAAAHVGATDMQGLLFGSADAGNGLSVDKPPAHLWIIALSIKLFGLSSLSVLAPQALMGVATVFLVYRTSLCWSSRRQALLGGIFVVLTPVTSMIFRFNNPDALLLFLWSLTVFFAVKSLEKHQSRYLYAASLILGVAFMCKQFQSWILAPALAIAFLMYGDGRVRARLFHLFAGALVTLIPASLWIAIVELTPPSQRPWIGGTSTNSFLDLTFGYNGLGRLTGQSDLGAVNPKGFSGVVGYDASLIRLFTINYAPEVAWLLPVAFVGAALLVIRLCRRSSSRLESYATTLLSIWFLTTFAVLSFMTGDIHPYYTSMLALPMASTAAAAFEGCWVNRNRPTYLRLAAVITLFCAVLTSGILTWFQDWQPWASFGIKVGALASAFSLIFPYLIKRPKAVATSLILAGVSILLLPAMFIIESISTSQQGSFPISGPVPTVESWHKRDAEQLSRGEKSKYALSRGEPVVAEIAAYIEGTPSGTRWAAATTGSENAALYQLATKRPVMSIGGFSALDPYPSLDSFKDYVRAGEVHYYIHQPGILSWSAGSNTLAVVSWIEDHYPYQEFSGVRLYDLSRELPN